jgi:cyclic-di-GMP-binding protein
MADASFDIVSKVDRQEVDNALNQAVKEIAQRYDFKAVGASIAWSGDTGVEIKANSEERAKAVLDVFQEKLIKRGISLKSLEAGDPKPSGKEFRLVATVKEGIAQDEAKKISKIIREEGPKGVQAQIQGDQLRVTSKKRDDLQEVIALLKGKELAVALQFTNYR